MAKRKLPNIRHGKSNLLKICGCHEFQESEQHILRESLLEWYDKSKRDLPWRIKGQQGDDNQRAYAVWVSEIMLQQTQVATVINYYNTWMEKWPSLKHLAQATLEEVNEVWSGLGYYSRGRRLHEGACKVVNELGGEIPKTAAAMLEHLPGVGPYTAGAISSIALGQVTGLVDGNVSRLMSRLRGIGADVSSQAVSEHMWKLANAAVDPQRPGDFNQALMEMGATICTPKSPSCSSCPVRSICGAYHKVTKYQSKHSKGMFGGEKGDELQKENASSNIQDIEELDECPLCFQGEQEWEASLGVTNYPRKGKKKKAKEEHIAVCIPSRLRVGTQMQEYLIVQRPSTGLLAGLWEFPSVEVSIGAEPSECQTAMTTYLDQNLPIQQAHIKEKAPLGEVSHLFSHKHHTYLVDMWSLRESKETCDEAENVGSPPHKWVTEDEFLAGAVSTAMKKVFSLLQMKEANSQKTYKKKTKKSKDGKTQMGLEAFFKPKAAVK